MTTRLQRPATRRLSAAESYTTPEGVTLPPYRASAGPAAAENLRRHAAKLRREADALAALFAKAEARVNAAYERRLALNDAHAGIASLAKARSAER